MKTIRLLLSALLILQNILLPFTYVSNPIASTRYASAAEEIPIIEIEYDTKDNYTPESKEYVNKVNAQATNGKLYNFYTLSGIVATVKAMEIGKDENDPESKGYYKTGVGAPGYLIVAYDAINSNSLSYQNWIAATTTNENGKFAIPIEKTRGGVYIVVLKQDGDSFRFITSYDVDSGKVNRATTKPENGLNIGVIEIPEDIKSIDQLQEDIPNSVKVYDEKTYWACGDKSSITYQGEDLTFKAEIPLTKNIESNFSLNKLANFMNGGEPLTAPTSPSIPFKPDPNEDYFGRTSIDPLSNQENIRALMSFFSGVSNPKEAVGKDRILPLCSEFLKSKTIDTQDPNKNYYTYNGMGALILPETVNTKMEKFEIQQGVLDSSDACRDAGGTIRKYSWLKEQGYQATILQDINRDENYKEKFAYKIVEDKPINDSIVNALEGTEDKVPREKPFVTDEEYAITNNHDPKGDTPGMTRNTIMKQNYNEMTGVYSKTYAEDPQGQLFNIPYTEVKTSPVFIYEMGPMKELCSISSVKDGGKELIKNEETKNEDRLGFKEDNRVTEGYLVTNEAIDAYQDGTPIPIATLGANIRFFDDVLKGSVMMQFLKNLIVTFKGFISPTEGLDTAGDTCNGVMDEDDPSTYNKLTEQECEASQDAYGEKSCEKVAIEGGTFEFRQPKNYTCSFEGKGKYVLEVESEDTGENATALKGSPADQAEYISDSFAIQPKERLQIGGAEMTKFDITGKAQAKDGRLVIKKSKEAPSRNATDSTRFSVTIPDGNEGDVLAYNTTLVKLIDRDVTSGEGNFFIFAGSGGGSGGGPSGPALYGSCPVEKAGSVIGCPSYPTCHGNATYWGSESCRYTIPFIANPTYYSCPAPGGSSASCAPADGGSCSGTVPAQTYYGYALDIDNATNKNVYLPEIGNLTQANGGKWTVGSTVTINGGSWGKGLTLTANDGTYDYTIYLGHIDNIAVSAGQSINVGTPIATLYEGSDFTRHVHIELIIRGDGIDSPVKPEDYFCK